MDDTTQNFPESRRPSVSNSGWARAVAPRMGCPAPTLSIPDDARTWTAATRVLAQRGRRRRVCRTSGHIRSVAALYHGRVAFRQPDSQFWSPILSQFRVVTKLAPCTKLIA
jgi:hypothetical protein